MTAKPPNNLDKLKSQSPLAMSSAKIPEPKTDKGRRLGIRGALFLFLLGGLTVSIVGLTQGMVLFMTQKLTEQENQRIKATLLSLENLLDDTQTTNEATAAAIANAVKAARVDLTNGQAIKSQQAFLNNVVIDVHNDFVGQSFHLITDKQGRIVAQTTEIIEEDFSKFPSLPTGTSVAEPKYRKLSLSKGMVLNLPIIENAIKTGKPLSGNELLKSSVLQKLGLAQQANIGIRPQPTQGLPELKKPFPEGTFDIDQGKIGLALVAVYPIEFNGKKVGTAVVGTLLNRNYALVDELSKLSSPDDAKKIVATLFAQDWRVSTNVPYPDRQTRAIGTRVSKEVAQTVLQQRKVFIGQANIVGSDYITGYSPLYDHQFQIDPTNAKPTGIAFVGESLATVQESIRGTVLIGYMLGGAILLGAALLCLAMAATFARPLRRLQQAAETVATGNLDIYVKPQGTLESYALGDAFNNLVSRVKALISEVQNNATQIQQQKDRIAQGQRMAEQGKALEEDVGQLLDVVLAIEEGDLTVQAPVSDRVTGLVSDSFNRLVEQLARIMAEVSSTSQQVTQNALNVEQLALQTAQQVQQQTQSVDVVQALMQNINDLTQDNVRQTQTANESVQQAQESVLRGQQKMTQLTQNVDLLGQGADLINKRVQTLNDFVQLTVQFAKDQRRIASMTRVLSLNASLLSTRATEQQDPEQFASIAREFETIATQVNDLAVQTSQSLIVLQQRTDQIQTVVSGLNQDAQEINQIIQNFTTGTAQSRQIFDEIRMVTEQVAQVEQQVMQSSLAIAETVETTLKSTQEIAALTSDTEQQANITRDRSETMEKVARDLYEMVRFFRIAPEQIQAASESKSLQPASTNGKHNYEDLPNSTDRKVVSSSEVQ
jgi:methyl-accepting chemotaxis protein